MSFVGGGRRNPPAPISCELLLKQTLEFLFPYVTHVRVFCMQASIIHLTKGRSKTIMMVSGRAVATALCALGTTSAFTGPLAAGSFRAVSLRSVDGVQLQLHGTGRLLADADVACGTAGWESWEKPIPESRCDSSTLFGALWRCLIL